MLLSAQEHLVPGDGLPARFALATDAGYDGLELRGRGERRFAARLPELRAAQRAGVVMPTVCVDMDHFIGDFDAARRRDATDNLRVLLSVIAEVGGFGAVTPAAWGMFSRRLPPFEPPRGPDGDREALLAALTELGEHAKTEGAVLLLEPLNRYEDHMVNTLAQAADLCRATGLASVRVCADLFHMQIEEADPPAALRAVADVLGHVQAGDSNRLQPGAGHTDFAPLLAALDDIGYTGWLALECRLDGDHATALRTAATHLRAAGERARDTAAGTARCSGG